MNIYARQGDLVFNRIDSIPGELTKQTNFILAGHDSAPHTIRGTAQVRAEGNDFFISLAETAQVVHAGRHQPVTLEPGNYRVTRLRERGDATDRVVED